MSLAALPLPKTRPWWQELLAVDFRHAFWPWVGYAVLVNLPYINRDMFTGDSAVSFICFFGMFAIAPMIPIRIFGTDFSTSTAESLLAYPRNRKGIWVSRMSLTVLLLGLPLGYGLARYIDFQIFKVSDYYDRHVLNMAIVACFALAHGPLFAVLLRNPMVAWSAAFVAFMGEVTVFAIVVPFSEDRLLSCLIPLGFILIGFTYYKWLRLEVRS